MDIIASVKRGLGNAWRRDYEETKLGWVCIRNENIYLGPKYLVAVNFPLQEPNFEYIYKYSWRSNRDLVHEIYSSINGLTVFGGKFQIPGVRAGLEPEGLLDHFNVPFDISVQSGYEFPLFAPCAGLVLGLSWRSIDGEERKSHDILAEDNKIISGHFDQSKEILETFNDLDEWIACRIRRAFESIAFDA